MVNYLSKVKEGGKVAIIEWKKIQSSSGPPLKQRINGKFLTSILTKDDIAIVKEINLNETHYAIVGKKI